MDIQMRVFAELDNGKGVRVSFDKETKIFKTEEYGTIEKAREAASLWLLSKNAENLMSNNQIKNIFKI